LLAFTSFICSIFKLAQGEYIAPEKIENVYVNHELVAQAFVYGDSLQAALVGIIVPDEPILLAWAKKNNLQDKTFAELCKTESVKKHLLQSLQEHGKQHDLKGFENVKALYLETELFSVENDLLVSVLTTESSQ
jgi:long-chain acyl-CoA synthetase